METMAASRSQSCLVFKRLPAQGLANHSSDESNSPYSWTFTRFVCISEGHLDLSYVSFRYELSHFNSLGKNKYRLKLVYFVDKIKESSDHLIFGRI